MADDRAGDGVQDLLADVGCMVGHLAGLVGDFVEGEGEVNGHGARGDAALRIFEDGFHEGFDCVFALQDDLGEARIGAGEGLRGVAKDALHAVGQDAERRGDVAAGRLEVLGSVGDGDAGVGDAFEFVVDLHDGEDFAKLRGVELSVFVGGVCEERDGGLFNLDVYAINHIVLCLNDGSADGVACVGGVKGGFDQGADAVALLGQIGSESLKAFGETLRGGGHGGRSRIPRKGGQGYHRLCPFTGLRSSIGAEIEANST